MSTAQTAGQVESRAISGSLYSFLTTAITFPVVTASVFVLARQLGVAGYGKYVAITFALSTLATIFDLGVGPALAYRATFAAGTDRNAMRAALSGTVTWSLLRASVMAVLAPALVGTFTNVWSIAYAAGYFLSVASSAPLVALTCERKYGAQNVSTLSISVASAVGGVAAAVTTGDYVAALACSQLGRGVAAIGAVVAVPNDMRAAVVFPGKIVLNRNDLSFARASFFWGTASAWVYGRSESVFLQHLSPASLGEFAAASTVAARSTLLTDAMYATLDTSLIAMEATNSEHSPRAIERSLRLSAGIGVLSAIVLVPTAWTLTPILFGRGYGSIDTPTLVLTILSITTTAFSPATIWASVRRSVRALEVSATMAAGLDALLCVLLVPSHGLWGAVVANAASVVTLSVILLCFGPFDARLRIRVMKAVLYAFCYCLIFASITVGFSQSALCWQLVLSGSILANAFATWFLARTCCAPLVQSDLNAFNRLTRGRRLLKFLSAIPRVLLCRSS